MTISEVSNTATPAIAGDNKATTGGPKGSRPPQTCAAVFGQSKVGHGVVGRSDNVVAAGVFGHGASVGIKGTSVNGHGVEGFGTGPNGTGVFGQGGVNKPAIFGNGLSPTQPGVLGRNVRGGPGVVGQSAQGTGIVGIGGTFAAEFVGKVRVTGDIILATAAFAQGEEYAVAEPEGNAMSSEAEVNSSVGAGEDSALAEISLAQKLAEIDARTKRIDTILTSLFRKTAQMPDGRTLVGVIGTIEAKIDRLKE